MELDFSSPGSVTINMKAYVNTMHFDASDEMGGTAVTLAAAHLFHVNKENPMLLSSNQKEIFVHLVMQALYPSQCGQPDIQTVVSFLCG